MIKQDYAELWNLKIDSFIATIPIKYMKESGVWFRLQHSYNQNIGKNFYGSDIKLINQTDTEQTLKFIFKNPIPYIQLIKVYGTYSIKDDYTKLWFWTETFYVCDAETRFRTNIPNLKIIPHFENLELAKQVFRKLDDSNPMKYLVAEACQLKIEDITNSKFFIDILKDFNVDFSKYNQMISYLANKQSFIDNILEDLSDDRPNYCYDDY